MHSEVAEVLYFFPFSHFWFGLGLSLYFFLSLSFSSLSSFSIFFFLVQAMHFVRFRGESAGACHPQTQKLVVPRC